MSHRKSPLWRAASLPKLFSRLVRKDTALFSLAIIGLAIFLIVSTRAHHRTIAIGHNANALHQNETISSSANPHQNTLPAIANIHYDKYRVPILMYHYIRVVGDPKDRLGFNLSVTPEHFDQQLTWLEDHHYQTFPLAEFVRGSLPRGGLPIILTFDDGYSDAYTQALPALQKHHFGGTFFIVSGFINKPAYLTSDQLEALKTAGMELGAHTMQHIDLATATPGRQKQEIEGSKQISAVFAYPAGRYSDVTIGLVKQAGFVGAVTTQYGIATDRSPLFELPRVRVSGQDNLAVFVAKVEGRHLGKAGR